MCMCFVHFLEYYHDATERFCSCIYLINLFTHFVLFCVIFFWFSPHEWLLLSFFFSCRVSFCEHGLRVFLFACWATNMMHPNLLFAYLFNSFT